MELQPGDWVRTPAGDRGRVILVSRLSVFVEIEQPGSQSEMVTFLASELKKIDSPPSDEPESSHER
jgi:hypothetical protein